ncbi:MAG: chromosome segregation protein SMC, partial [Gallionella sp.]|nr:chromosome segregation protein SMC [Gallionella sp.]
RQRIQTQVANTERQLSQQRQQHQAAADMLQQWRGEQQVAAERLAEAEMVAEELAQRLPQIEDDARAAQEHHHALQREQMQLQQCLHLADTQLASLQRNIAQLEARRARLIQEQANLPKPNVQLLLEMQQQQIELEMLRAEHQEKLAQLQEQLPQIDHERRSARATLQQFERASSQTEARLHALQQLQRQLDNDKNMQGWLQHHGLEKLPRLWQSVTILAGWEDALEAVLRERLNAFALPDINSVSAWTGTPPGKLALFALTDTCSASTVRSEFTPLLDYVVCQDERVVPVMREWLASVYAITDLVSALTQAEKLPLGAFFVTPQGHLVGRNNMLFHAPDSDLHGVLGRQAEIIRLEQALDEQQQAATATRQQVTAVEQQYQSIESLIPPLRNEVNTLQQRQHAVQIQVLKLAQENERSAERSTLIERELQEAAELLEVEQLQWQAVLEQGESTRTAIAAFQTRLEQAANHANDQDRVSREQRGRVQQAQHALQETRFYSRTCTEKIADLQRNIEQLAASYEQAEQNLAALQEDMAGVADESASQVLQQALLSRQLCEQALFDARNRLEAETQAQQNVERARLSSEQQLNQLHDRLNALALKEQEARLYFEQWDVQLQGVDELVLLPQLVAWKGKPATLQLELNRLCSAIDALGAVNLAALEELQTATERKQYLDAQAADLQEAMATLEEAIRRIDRESRDLLMATYDQVNLHLAELFPILFAGGEARLVLTGEEILDSGVQVMAQPPGKKNSTIHLLSGGEKALTAIALVFSLFQLNPAPFCLLDEVDAPLDDTNTERLCALIRRMSQQTQFVFISHNKIAMEMALQLIGVTMQEKGVSKIVSVDIEEALRMRDEAD